MVVSRGLVVFQILMTCILLIVSMLQLQSIRNQQNIDFGFDTESVLAGRMGLMQGDYPENVDRRLFYDKLRRELKATGQFESVSITGRFRMVFAGNGPIEIEGKQYQDESDRTLANIENISPEFFKTIGLKIIEGRDFNENDTDQNEPVAIVNSSFVNKYLSNESPIGQRIRTINGNGTNPGPWRRIIGVVPSVRMQGPFNNQVGEEGFYIPLFATAFGTVPEEPQAPRFGTIVVKPRGGQNPAGMVNQLQSLVNVVDPNLPMYFVETPQASLDSFMTQGRLVGQMFLVFGIIAVVLAAVGLYGIMSFSVNQRTQEFGVRMALGANNSSILNMVMRQAGIQLLIGLVLGLGVTLGISIAFDEQLANNLNEISSRDPLTYIGVALLLTMVAAVSSFVPARRATRVDPMIALRAE
jgi:putative ABC transport system permease protein